MFSVLLVEYDRDLALSIIDHLEPGGFICDYAANGVEGLALTEDHRYDTIILDSKIQGAAGNLTSC